MSDRSFFNFDSDGVSKLVRIKVLFETEIECCLTKTIYCKSRTNFDRVFVFSGRMRDRIVNSLIVEPKLHLAVLKVLHAI